MRQTGTRSGSRVRSKAPGRFSEPSGNHPIRPAIPLHSDTHSRGLGRLSLRFRARAHAPAIRHLDPAARLCRACRHASSLTAPNRFVLQWVKDRFGPRIETLAREATGTEVAGRFRGRGRQPGDAPASVPRRRPPGTRASQRPPHLRRLSLDSPRRPDRLPAAAGSGSPPSIGPLAVTGGVGASSPGASIPASPSRPSSPARPTSSPAPPGCRSPTTRRRTTRCSSTAASGSARRT